MFQLWRVASTDGARSRGQGAVLLALPPARNGASAGCKEAAGSGAAALVTGTRRWPEQGPRLPAAFLVAKLPIYFSSGDDRRMQRARATTARYGRDSAAAGQGARARSRQRAEGATAGCTNGEASQHPGASADQLKWAGVRGSSAYNCNLRLPAIRRKLSVPALASCLSCFVYVAASRVSS